MKHILKLVLLVLLSSNLYSQKIILKGESLTVSEDSWVESLSEKVSNTYQHLLSEKLNTQYKSQIENLKGVIANDSLRIITLEEKYNNLDDSYNKIIDDYGRILVLNKEIIKQKDDINSNLEIVNKKLKRKNTMNTILYASIGILAVILVVK